MTSRLIDVVCMCVSNNIVKRKTYECLIFLSFRKMLLKKKYVADNFLSKFQDEDKRFINIYHFGIEPMGFQTPLTLELLSKTIINPGYCKGKYPCVNKLFETCSNKEKQNNLQIVKTYSNLYACGYTKFSRDSLKCASCGLYPCQYCHHLPYILAEIIHKPMITKHASFYNKKNHQDTHAHNFTMQCTELTYRFKDLLPNCIIYNDETK